MFKLYDLFCSMKSLKLPMGLSDAVNTQNDRNNNVLQNNKQMNEHEVVFRPIFNQKQPHRWCNG